VRLLRFVLLIAAVVLGLTPAARPIAADVVEAHCPVAAAMATAHHADGAAHDTGTPQGAHVPADCCLGGIAVLAAVAGDLPPRERQRPPRGVPEVDQLTGLSPAPASPPPERTV